MNSHLPTIDFSRFRIEDLSLIFESNDRGLLEDLAQAAREVTRHYFGRAISLYAPLYISNYCRNQCAYCGFHASSDIRRRRLSAEEIEKECAALSTIGIRSCLILTGESRYHSGPAYIKEAIGIANRYFSHVALEVYPLETNEYRELYAAGADGVTLFQETYDRSRYDELHLAGPKKNYDYRFGAPERMAQAGFRQITMGVLLGLADWRNDVSALFRHVRSLERRYPGIEYGFSFPRLRPLADDQGRYFEINDRDMVKIVSVARLLFPRAGINLSTRESAGFRDSIIELGITRMSAGSLTTVGGYEDAEKAHDSAQFQVHDRRSLAEVKAMLLSKGFDPVVTDWRNISNQ
jgi:2-iminoacetate synthase